jgi:hypothetical protein
MYFGFIYLLLSIIDIIDYQFIGITFAPLLELLEHAMALEKATIKYPLTRVETIQYTINKGVVCETLDNVSSKILPYRIIFGMVEATAAQGGNTMNTFNFKNFDLSQISVTVDNHDVPNSPLNLNSKENPHIRAYYNLFSGINIARLDWGNEITKEVFIGGYGLYSFD